MTVAINIICDDHSIARDFAHVFYVALRDANTNVECKDKNVRNRSLNAEPSANRIKCIDLPIVIKAKRRK